jgi:mannose-6-phosphate isomerase-like protein (cupin superfamily)
MIARVSTALPAILLAASVSTFGAQAQPPAPKPAAQPQAAKPTAPATRAPAARTVVAARGAVVLVVTDMVGKTIPAVRVALTGAMLREGRTSPDGALTFEGLRPGTYRLRFEADDFITLEREVAVKNGPAVEVDVALDRAPARPVEPPPPPPQKCRDEIAPDPHATASFTELPAWIDRNLIGRSDPPREDAVGSAPALGASVLQVGNPTPQRVRNDADEALYVIAGEGVLQAGGRSQALRSGSLAVIPRGVAYTLERRSRGPLVVLSVAGK